MGVLGLILARGGSKRIPRKNLRSLGGKPLIQWTIEAAWASTFLDAPHNGHLVVSSEDDEILEFSRGLGVHTIRRPKEMADDGATVYPAIIHALDTVKGRYSTLCLLQATSPFRTAVDIDDCLLTHRRSGLSGVASAERGEKVPNGAVYVGQVDWLRGGGHFDRIFVGRTHMPAERSLDIDTEDDWVRAEEMLKVAA